jgi:hypothetical protein
MPRSHEQLKLLRFRRLLFLVAVCFVLNILASLICASLVLQDSLSFRRATLLAPHGVFQGQLDRAWAVAGTHEKASGLAGGLTRSWLVPGASRVMLILLYEDKFRSTNERIVSESVWGGFPFVAVSCQRCYWLPALASPSARSNHPWKFGIGAADVLESDATHDYSTTTPTTTPVPFRPEAGGLVFNPLIYAVVWLGLNWLRCWIVRCHRRRRGCCPKCGYSLNGIRVSSCPECGEDVA